MKPAALLPALAALLLASCDDQSMTRQNRYSTYGTAALFPNGSEAQPLPEHVVARGDLRRDNDASHPPPVDIALLERGRARYDIYCSPCHGLSGKGDGMVVRRGFPAPPSLHVARLLEAPERHVFDTITQGHGVMPSLADRVTPEDRWAIAAYVRALQRSRAMPVAMLDDAQRASLAAMQAPSPVSAPASAASGAAR